jgi:hypothetical protein
VVNVLVLWSTRYINAALERLDATGLPVEGADIERLSPLGFGNVNLHGRYSFSLPDDLARGGLRPLRDSRDLDESDEE